RGGETVRGICRSSGAKVQCEREPKPEASLCPVRVIQLFGTRSEVAAAKKLILEKLTEDNAFHRELEQSAATRYPRKQALGSRRDPQEAFPDGLQEHREELGGWESVKGSLPRQGPCQEPEDRNEELEEPEDGNLELEIGNEDLETEPEDGNEEHSVPKFEIPSPDFSFQADEHLEVYVSASENPSHFWIQIIGRRVLHLDKLTVEMRQYYQSSPTAHPVSICAGDIVAAPYRDDDTWYRTRVLGLLDNGNWDLYYVDFGDNGEAPTEALRPLRSDFLSLPFQAIECSLAGISPAGNTWEEAALDEFDRLTHCAQWIPLVARISSYSQSGLCPMPSIHLFTERSGQGPEGGQSPPRPEETA
ncbi:PREDICTED: LOW QUALITY PROTEIN: tudor and KH domain-containing protein, partial [Acanthisitta chloris]|uniref:LOW QUALITY PROTEIN: tudor and KH domain-containing protein n=1 Tax=Acanthisitta chloris TaxID=57068 RepID=UPI0004F0F852